MQTQTRPTQYQTTILSSTFHSTSTTFRFQNQLTINRDHITTPLHQYVKHTETEPSNSACRQYHCRTSCSALQILLQSNKQFADVPRNRSVYLLLTQYTRRLGDRSLAALAGQVSQCGHLTKSTSLRSVVSSDYSTRIRNVPNSAAPIAIHDHDIVKA